MKPEKCALFKKEVLYLGHVIFHDGIATNPTKVEAVHSWPTPQTVRDARVFTAFCSYYRRFVKAFTKIA